MKNKIWVTAIVTILVASFIPIIIEIVQTTAFAIIEVDDSGGKDYQTIQEAVDAALPGDTVFVYAGIYYEDVTITKTINLTGEDRDTTIINSTNKIGIYVTNADYVNITGFTVVNGSWAGIRLMPSNNSRIENNRVEKNEYGIEIVDSNNTIVRDNIASYNSNYHGIYLSRSTNITVENNTCFGNQGAGIYVLDDSYKNLINENNCSNNADGIRFSSTSYNNLIYNNTIISNLNYGIGDFSNGGNIYINNSIINSWTGFYIATFTQDVRIYNSTIENSSGYDISVAGSNTHFTTINTTFDKTKSYFGSLPANLLMVKWYIHVNVEDYLGNPVPNAQVKIKDNVKASYNETFMTDINGHLQWLTVTEYIEQDTDGNNIGEKTYHTPHNIVAWNDTLVGYIQPFMNESKTVTIVLYNGTLMDLEPGWNLISLPRPQSDTNIQTVLQSLEDQYDAVQWFDNSYPNKPWKHNNVGKPFGNDLFHLNETMGFWIHITNPGDTIFLYNGTQPTSNQSIPLHPGWNMVGYPSLTNRNRTAALNNLTFGIEVDAIWIFNAATQSWEEIGAGDYFEVGRGYWIHATQECVWEVGV